MAKNTKKWLIAAIIIAVVILVIVIVSCEFQATPQNQNQNADQVSGVTDNQLNSVSVDNVNDSDFTDGSLNNLG